MDWNKSTADKFMQDIFTYVNNESLRDLQLSPSMAFNSHVHSTKFLVDARAILEEGTVGYVAIKCSRRWGERLVFPSTATIKELVKDYNIPLEVRISENALAVGALPCCFCAFSRGAPGGRARCEFCSGVCGAGGWRLRMRFSPRTARRTRARACARPRGLVAY